MAGGKKTREFDGHHYVLETALKANVSPVKAWKADTAGNLIYRKTARNFNPAVTTAGKVCVAEAEIIVELGAAMIEQARSGCALAESNFNATFALDMGSHK